MSNTGTYSRCEQYGQGTLSPAPLDLARGKEFYRVFSLLFHRPDREFAKYLWSGFIEDIGFLGDDVVAGFARFLDTQSEKGDDSFYYALAVEYTRLFVNAVPRVPCPPYESVYRENTTMGESTLAVLARYREAGLEVLGSFQDLPDHVAVELEFLHFLLAKGDIEAHNAFLREHLSTWVSAFSRAIVDNSRIDFYRHAAVTLERTITELAAEPGEAEVNEAPI